ncbi:hypothetical protein ASG76_00625 [Nocardioides sp. Soil774]|uniref:O-antigen ligase family protein n=1 Tax=Nocardioides sp. Soil774 TaxID=1736408 RepID=UPI0006F74810|nr:O-antigen ligase family protein [Nocardioides sp. Soil774]KRE97268.1 hypothetical protein ASG76_00625 [Nocardioides sp. Soil774]
MVELADTAPAHRTRSREGVAQSVAAGLLGTYVVVGSLVPYLYGPWLACAIMGALVLLVASQRELSMSGMAWLAGLLSVGLLGFLVGTLNDNPGVVPTATVYVVEPVVIGAAFILLLQTSGGLSRVLLILDLSIVAIVLVAIALYVTWYVGAQMPAWLVDPAYSAVDVADGTPRTNFQGFNAFVFLGAYGVARLSVRVGGWEPRWWRFAVALLAVVGIVLSGRRILFLAIPAALLIVWSLTRIKRSDGASPVRQVRWVVGGGLVLVVVAGLAIWFTPLRQLVAGLFTVQSAEGPVDPRLDQHAELLKAWWESPIWGRGAGYVIPGYERSEAFPWIFELSYHVLLMNFGVIGIVILAAWTWWVGSRLAVQVSESLASAAVLAGFLSTILATTSNPYLSKLEGLWMVMIPFGVACLGSRKVGLRK